MIAKKGHIFIFLLLGIFFSCNSDQNANLAVYRVNFETNPINGEIKSSLVMDSMVAPYQRELAREMDEIISYSKTHLERGLPQGKLGNLMTDISLHFIIDNYLTYTSSPVVCIMNYGGIRAPINKGDITKGDIFKVMPFDNTLVMLGVSTQIMDSIHTRILDANGEPFSGFTIDKKSWSFKEHKKKQDTVWVVTTDYLAGGGDRMGFLKYHFTRENTGVLLRDLLLEEIERKDTLNIELDQRIVLE